VAGLPPERLYRRTDPALFDFDSTADLPGSSEPVGQPRAVAAVRFGVAVEDDGFNVFALGPAGTGKRHFVEGFLAAAAAGRGPGRDLCYVHDFERPNQPRALLLPAGMGVRLRDDMRQLVDEVAAALPAAFEEASYQARLQAIEENFKRRPIEILEALRSRAETRGIAMVPTGDGMAFAAIHGGSVLDPDAFARLAPEMQAQYRAEIESLSRELQAAMRELPRWRSEHRSRVRALHEEVSAAAVAEPVAALRSRYVDVPGVLAFLDAVAADLVHHARDVLQLRETQESDPFAGAAPRPHGDLPFWRRYGVNVLVDRREERHAPVVYEDHPTFQNLLGRIEHTSQQGTLVTDFTHLRAGALHRANGGYLLLDARKVLEQPFAWDGLKRALRGRSLALEPMGAAWGMMATSTLEPERVPLDVKVVLLGDRELYYLLASYDPEFRESFKVAADFDDAIERTPENERAMAHLIAAIARRHALLAFDRAAVARVLEDAARRAGDATRLSANSGALADLLREASHWTLRAGRTQVGIDDVERALAERRLRVDRLPTRLRAEMLRGALRIETDGGRVGQVNGLSVLDLPGQRFGRPTRITARVRLGKGDVIDIEREVALGGPIHTKGVLILASYIAAQFAPEEPLSLSASLVFEQSYGGVEGDSASSAELFALLSAIAEAPIDQGLASTGSVDQFGVIQPVGGVDEKIEGFFDLCAAQGLTGRQGVLIPEANAAGLMLRREVVDAVAAGAFHVHPIRHVAEGVALLMGRALGERGADGRFPSGTIGAQVRARLASFTRTWGNLSRGEAS
jgi:lon-related putative ATP-dependent protease